MSETQEKTYYDLLGVPKEASKEDIKRAYRDIAQVYHPDSNFFSEITGGEKPDDSASDVFKAITAAYNILLNEEKRLEYDRSLLPKFRTWDQTETTLTVSPEKLKEALRQKATKQPANQALGRFGVQSGNTRPNPQASEDVSFRPISEMIKKNRGPLDWLWRILGI